MNIQRRTSIPRCIFVLFLIATDLLSAASMWARNTSISYSTINGGVMNTPQGEFWDATGTPIIATCTNGVITFETEPYSIGNYAFHNCPSLSTLTLPNSVEEIGYFAFSNCVHLSAPIFNDKLFARLPICHRGNYEIPQGISTISSAAFRNCTQLTGISIPSSVENIESSAFSGCTALESITIPATVHQIEDYAFFGCTNLKRIYFEAEVPADFSTRAFEGLDNCVLFVPKGNLIEYQMVCGLPVAPIVAPGTTKIEAAFAGDFSNEALFNVLNEAISETQAFVIDLKGVDAVPANASITMPHKNCIIKTSRNLGLLNTQNIVIETVCDKLVISDDEAFFNDESFEAKNAIYQRSMHNTWGTICLPFAVTSDETIQYFTSGKISDDILTLEPTKEVKAGEPAIFKRLGEDSLEALGTNVRVAQDANEPSAASNIILHGTFSRKDLYEEGLYYIANNKFWRKTEGQPLIINAFRAWFSISSNSNARSLSISEEETASIKALEAMMKETATYYDINGNQLPELQQGMNIVKCNDGTTKKVLVK